jgi:hypothetical protein
MMLEALRLHGLFHNDWLGLGWPATPNLCVHGERFRRKIQTILG